MINSDPTLSTVQEVIGMAGKLVSRVPQLLEQKGWNARTLAGHMMIRGSSPDTAYRMARGETQFTTETLLMAADILGCKSIAELIDAEWDEQTG
jgi:hypothetical protein